jgi:hypothetical protein
MTLVQAFGGRSLRSAGGTSGERGTTNGGRDSGQDEKPSGSGETALPASRPNAWLILCRPFLARNPF